MRANHCAACGGTGTDGGSLGIVCAICHGLPQPMSLRKFWQGLGLAPVATARAFRYSVPRRDLRVFRASAGESI